MTITELIEQLQAMPEKREGSNSEGDIVVLNTHKLAEALNEIRTRLVYLYGLTDGTFNPPALKEIYEIADSALAAPKK